MSSDASYVLSKIADCASCQTNKDEIAKVAVEAIRDRLSQANWVGIYWLEGETLVLGPYVGSPTEHTRIPVGKGVCGTAVAEDRDQIVPDVRRCENYLPCSSTTRSEIVVLVRSHGKIVGQIDLDSDHVDAFAGEDHSFLTLIAGALGSVLDIQPGEPTPAVEKP